MRAINVMSAALVAVTASTLAACGGGGSSTTTTQPIKPPANTAPALLSKFEEAYYAPGVGSGKGIVYTGWSGGDTAMYDFSMVNASVPASIANQTVTFRPTVETFVGPAANPDEIMGYTIANGAIVAIPNIPVLRYRIEGSDIVQENLTVDQKTVIYKIKFDNIETIAAPATFGELPIALQDRLPVNSARKTYTNAIAPTAKLEAGSAYSKIYSTFASDYYELNDSYINGVSTLVPVGSPAITRIEDAFPYTAESVLKYQLADGSISTPAGAGVRMWVAKQPHASSSSPITVYSMLAEIGGKVYAGRAYYKGTKLASWSALPDGQNEILPYIYQVNQALGNSIRTAMKR